MSETSDSGWNVFASLVIVGKDLDPDEVSNLVGLQPHDSFRKGDPRGRAGRWDHGFWRFSTKGLIASNHLGDHVHFLVIQLVGRLDSIKQAVMRCGSGTVSCFASVQSELYGFRILSEDLVVLGELGLPIDIDIGT